MNDKSSTRRPWILAGAAAVGVVAVLAGVYVTLWGAGNGPEATACRASGETVARLVPLVRGEVAAVIPAEEPKDVSMLAFNGTDGAPMTLGDLKGTPLLLNLWATWCVPCREEMPALDRLQAERGGESFRVVTVNVDVGDPEKPAAFLAEIGATRLPDYRDPRMKIFNDLKTRGLAFGMPTTLLVDAAGCQVAALHGPAEWDSPDALALVDALTGG